MAELESAVNLVFPNNGKQMQIQTELEFWCLESCAIWYNTIWLSCLFCIALSSVLFYMMNMIVLCYYCDKVKKSKCAQKMIQDKMPEVNAICCLKWECVSNYPRLLL